jgi:hypothetical protein
MLLMSGAKELWSLSPQVSQLLSAFLVFLRLRTGKETSQRPLVCAELSGAHGVPLKAAGLCKWDKDTLLRVKVEQCMGP